MNPQKLEQIILAIKNNLPPTSFCFGYGSGVKPQKGYNYAQNNQNQTPSPTNQAQNHPMIDLIFVTEDNDPRNFIFQNHKKNPQHFSGLAHYLSPNYSNFIQRNLSPILFFPYLTHQIPLYTADNSPILKADQSIDNNDNERSTRLSLYDEYQESAIKLKEANKKLIDTKPPPFEEYEYKYGVIGKTQFIKDLSHWNLMLIAGRLHKPVYFLEEYKRSTLQNDLLLKKQLVQNLRQAVVVSIQLMIETLIKEDFNQKSRLQKQGKIEIEFEDLMRQIISLSYMGDIRTHFRFESKNKISQIYEGNKEGFQEMYLPILKELGLEIEIIRHENEFQVGKIIVDLRQQEEVSWVHWPKGIIKDSLNLRLEDDIRAINFRSTYSTVLGLSLFNSPLKNVNQLILFYYFWYQYGQVKYSFQKLLKNMKSAEDQARKPKKM